MSRIDSWRYTPVCNSLDLIRPSDDSEYVFFRHPLEGISRGSSLVPIIVWGWEARRSCCRGFCTGDLLRTLGSSGYGLLVVILVHSCLAFALRQCLRCSCRSGSRLNGYFIISTHTKKHMESTHLRSGYSSHQAKRRGTPKSQTPSTATRGYTDGKARHACI